MYYLLLGLLVVVVFLYAYRDWKFRCHEHLTSCSKKCRFNESGPMDRVDRPSCFFYDIDTQNEQLYAAADQTAQNLDTQVVRSMDLNKKFYDLANEYNQKLTTFMSGPIVNETRANMREASTLLSNALKSNSMDSDMSIYEFNEKDREAIIKSALATHITGVINELIKSSNIDFNAIVSNKLLAGNTRDRIVMQIMKLYFDRINQQGNQDIVGTLRSIIQSMDLNRNIPLLINNAIRANPALQRLEKLANDVNVNLGDFVYFRHKLSKAIPFLCADNQTQFEIIVGGKVCDINYVNNTVRISYLFVMNPNDNTRCDGTMTSAPNNITRIDYSAGPEGFPKWYIPRKMGDDCGPNAPANIACFPAQWDASNDSWVSQWIGGVDRPGNKMQCGVSPKEYDLPVNVPFGILSKNLNRLVQECKNDLSLIKRI